MFEYKSYVVNLGIFRALPPESNIIVPFHIAPIVR